ncbi:beta-ketoacyl synthase domain-containing protein [Fusarium heterosporum]|uniref:Beta-ketoacyl synthase domain-containing protein n=1 Tax=Fusarium heterosporum TaxID=42747 RepID=A0A8H5WQ29_FUSHE|nr:beta-ketoacyl synthase domain-containing protein [Fusarium heterosporum]
MAQSKSWKTEPVAIVGASCRFPGGANSPSKLWQILRDPPDLRKEIPRTKFNQHSFHHPKSANHGTSNVSHSYLLEEDVGEFDHAFFNINPKEAESMDPQQRLLLETVYEGIESAGYAVSELRGSDTGVFVGQMTDDYYDILNKDVSCAPQYTATGSSRAIIANRVSYFFDWRGPSLNIDTACSSSLVALHQAVQALRSGEINLAVAAGVNLILGPEKYIYESQLSMLSPTGRSRMWDTGADGYARGEGFTAVIIKTLSQALADNDDIECIIRETGVNQDGRSEGLTVPSSQAQASLIQSTYSKCGLDWRSRHDRCQYFEAHGTGTQAGDPKEARAIRDAFFSERIDPYTTEKLYVGSVKTVIGHLEGAAGLAGLLKAALAVKRGQVPPNLHFNVLNPKIKPFYEFLEVPTSLQSWPELPKGVPRRASINSFGFGGTNAHAIIESWDASMSYRDEGYGHRQHWGPLTLSANSQEGLMSSALSLSQFLKANLTVNLQDLAWTLQLRREHFPFRTAFAVVDREDMIRRLDSDSSDVNTLSIQSSKATRVSEKYPVRILGVFTGQGAQWPRMGAELYKQSTRFRQTINELQESLDDLPDGPSWSLSSELLAPAKRSRVKIAEIAQPICTAVQIALVDLARVAGISFHGVLGHSSGEIAAAYASGYLSASDSIRIAYYRGLHSHLSSSPTGQPGKMMAIGLSFQNAKDFCERPRFVGRISVAASNARSSVTVSGDADAIVEAKEVLDAEGTFARELQVDKAYHSHHMKPCSEAYLNSLLQCRIKVRRTDVNGDCIWYSSVHGSAGRYTHEPETFSGQYWVDNLVKPVMFSQALDRAVQESQRLDLVLEVGPHPALRGPASDLIKALTGIALPYCGLLKRGENDLCAFSEALGFIWRHVHVDQGQQPLPDFEAFARACVSDPRDFRPQVCKELPGYPWDHAKSLFWESRTSKLWRSRQKSEHKLLGVPTISGNHQDVHWRKIMRVSEMEWLSGHKFQNQVLFPAAGYVCMAIEAVSHLVPDQQDKTRVIELNDMKIHRAITLSEQSSIGTEVTFTIHTRKKDSTTTIADFSCFSVEADAGADEQSKCNFTGSATVMTSNTSAQALQPARSEPRLPLTDVDLDQFYSSVSSIGLDYSGDFVAKSINRRLGFATVSMSQNDRHELLVDPAVLDTSFHGVFSAFCYPNDGRMWTAYLPTSIRRIRVTPRPVGEQRENSQSLQKHFSADCTLREASNKIIVADVDLYSALGDTLECQLEGLTCTSFTTQSPDQDRKLFSRTVWRKDISGGIENNRIIRASHDDNRLYEVLERTSYYFLRRLRDGLSTSEIQSENMAWHYKASLGWVLERLLPSIENGQHPRVKAEWSSDSEEDIQNWRNEFGDEISLRAVHAIGQAYAEIVRGTIPPLQILMEDDVLNRLYKDCIGGQTANRQVGELVGQLAHRYPQMNILEIGAGTGGTTTTALRCLNSNFASYTYTDISPGFFEKAASAFSSHAHKMIFKTLDIERDPEEQGYELHSFDVIMAANVLHATKHLDETMSNCHKLLKPGGRMILLEITSEALWIQTIFSALPGWWLGQEEGRINHPTISIDEWEVILRRQGFSGVDIQCRDLEDENRYTFSVFTTQALDDRVQTLRDPLLMGPSHILAPHIGHMVLIGPESCGPELTRLMDKIENLLCPFSSSISVARGLRDPSLAEGTLPIGSVVISILDLQKATFREIDDTNFNALKSVFNNSSTILWATRGCRADDPYANIMVGLGRSVMQELAYLNLQFVDLDPTETEDAARLLSNMLLRMLCTEGPEFEDVVWSRETETAICDGDLCIPRILPEEAPNKRINSGRRTIQDRVDLSEEPVTLRIESPSGVCWLEKSPSIHQITVDSSSLVEICVQACSLFPLVTKDGQSYYICVGTTVESTEVVLALTSTNSSMIRVPADKVMLIRQSSGTQSTPFLPALLRVALIRILCESAIKPLEDVKATLWVHAADPLIARIAREIASEHGIDVLWTTSSNITQLSEDGDDQSPVVIHPFIADRELVSQKLSHNGCLLTFEKEPISGFYTRLASRLDETSEVRHLAIQASSQSHLNVSLMVDETRQVLERMVRSPMAECPTYPATPVNELPTSRATAPHISGPLDIVNWEPVRHVTAIVKPLDTKNLFSGSKTYFLVGLTGELGLGLCNWMINNGARHIALSSRKPNIDSRFLSDWEMKGAKVQVFSLDLANEKMLHEVHRQILETMPPVGGVMNGAMVLRDRPFSTMSLDDFQAVLKPKVRGSELLDNLFHSDSLEFFILFSSLSRVIGNPGQSNYAAANMFMASLASQRRARGVSASVIDIAMLVGFGWMWRNAGEILEAQMKAAAYMSISEPEFHTIMAEAIEAGRPGSGLDPEIHTGLAESNTASWKRFPRFSHYVSSKEQKVTETGTGSGPIKTLRQSISEAGSDGDILAAIESALSHKLRLVLQLADTGSPMDPKTALLSLGIDSLVAVELRSWFLKELSVDVPTLRILSDATIADISIEVMSKLDISLKDHEVVSEVINIGAKKSEIASSDIPVGPSIAFGSDEISSTSPSEASSEPPAESERWLNTPGSPDSTASPSVAASTKDGENIAKPEVPSIDNYDRMGRMSHSQEALHFLHEYLSDRSSQNVLFYGRYAQSLDFTRFQTALDLVTKRHEALRSAYFVDTSTQGAVQAVTGESGIEVLHMHLDFEAEVDGQVQQLRKHAFDIASGKLMVVAVLSISPNLHYIIFVHHHIAMDAQATIVFLTDLTKAYAGVPLGVSPPQAIDVSTAIQSECTTIKLADKIAYWKDIHQRPLGALPLLPFARTRSRKSLFDYDLDTFDITLDTDLCSLIRGKCSELRVTPFHFYLASFHALLARCLNDSDDINIGIVDSNRGLVNGDAEALGCYLNLLPLRVNLKPNETFDKLAQRTRHTVMEGLANAGVPFEMLLDQLKVSRNSTHHPLFQVILNYRLGIPSSSQFGDGKIDWMAAMAAKNSYDIAVEVSDTPHGSCVLSFTTQRYLYGSADTKMLMKCCPLVDSQAMREAKNLGLGPEVDITWEGTLIDQIMRIAAKFPTSTAIKQDDGNQITYSKMIERVDQISQGLESKEIIPGSRIAVLLLPDIDSICVLMAVLRRGLTWVPLDARNHHERLVAILGDSKPRHIIFSKDTADLAKVLVNAGSEGIAADDLLLGLEELTEPRASSCFDGFLNLSKRCADAVILYTSGSTGVPKGVRLTHLGLLNQIYVLADVVGERQVVLHQTSHGFDMALDQIFNALARGGTLIVVGQNGRGDPRHLAKVMLSEAVTYTCIVPSEYHMMFQHGFDHLKQCDKWQYAHAGGEKVTHHLRRAFRDLSLPSLKLFNAYGPTETYLGCARGLIAYQTEQDIVAESDGIRVLPNYSLTIVDENLSPVPSGFPGEICISSQYSISPGYIDRPEETQHRFIDSSLMRSSGLPSGVPVYRTGDVGRLSPDDGTLTVLGRIGSQMSQVKIRGQRVELEDIAAIIVRCSNKAISNAAVSWRPDDEILVALIVLSRDVSQEGLDWAMHGLGQHLPLPQYMRPTVWISVPVIPTNSNGKADRAAIDQYPIPPRHAKQQGQSKTSAKSVHTYLSKGELQVARIWKQVLEDITVDTLDSSTDFFYLGGNSRNLIELRHLLEQEFAPIKLRLPDLFHHNSLSGMTALVSELDNQDVSGSAETRTLQMDWKEEVAYWCREAIRSQPQAHTNDTTQANSGRLVVVLTGATGFLGASIARRLVDDDRVGEVHCIAIRDSDAQTRRVSVQSDKIYEHVGNLESPLLGLADDEFRHLSSRADIIIHNGAQVSFLKTYQSLRQSNVASTVALCRMALVRSIPLHFVSTGAVALVPTTDHRDKPSTLHEESSSDRIPSPDSQSGYQDSKWVAEQILEQVSQQCGLPVVIHRPASIVGAGAPKLDLMAAILNTSRALSMVPELHDHIEGPLDLVSLQGVSGQLVLGALEMVRMTSTEENTAKFVHHCNVEKLHVSQLRRHLQEEDGQDTEYSLVSLDKWLNAAAQMDMEPLLHNFLTDLLTERKKVLMPVLM